MTPRTKAARKQRSAARLLAHLSNMPDDAVLAYTKADLMMAARRRPILSGEVAQLTGWDTERVNRAIEPAVAAGLLTFDGSMIARPGRGPANG